MTKLSQGVKKLRADGTASYEEIVTSLEEVIKEAGYNVAEKNVTKPWGAYFRLESSQADEFVTDFFPDITPDEARLGVEGAELSPKFLIVKPGERLSWQYHGRRAERWQFLTPGAYRKSDTDSESDRIEASIGEIIQFQKGERHRLEGCPDAPVLVAEIWQHTDRHSPSDEDDIIRLQDDYKR